MPKGLSTQGTDQDDVVIMPFTSAMKRVSGGNTLRTINAQVASAADLAPAQQQIISLLRQRHNIREGRDDDFTVRNQQEIAEAATATSQRDDAAARRDRRRFARSSAASAS